MIKSHTFSHFVVPVPFVIHAIIKIRGGVASLWNKKSEELTAEAFAAVVNNKKGPDDALFGPGDVIVARVSPWKARCVVTGIVWLIDRLLIVLY